MHIFVSHYVCIGCNTFIIFYLALAVYSCSPSAYEALKEF